MQSRLLLNSFIQLDWREWKRPMLIALVVSLVLHLIFLAFQWHDETEQERRLKTPLSVVLVNARSAPPAEAKRLAQADLNGGGESVNTHASALSRADPQVAQQLEKMQAEQTRLLSQLKSGRENQTTTVTGKSSETKTEANPLEAELAKRLQMNGQQPRRAVVTATSAKSVVFAQYYDAMRKQSEAHGTVNFPRVQGKALYGSLVLMVSVDQQGRLAKENQQGGKIKEAVIIMKSSGNQELDRQAVAIIRSAAPFGRFTDAMRRQIDVLDWVSTFEFTREGGELKLDLKN